MEFFRVLLATITTTSGELLLNVARPYVGQRVEALSVLSDELDSVFNASMALVTTFAAVTHPLARRVSPDLLELLDEHLSLLVEVSDRDDQQLLRLETGLLGELYF